MPRFCKNMHNFVPRGVYINKAYKGGQILDRVPYRRVTPPRGSAIPRDIPVKPQEKTTSTIETVIIQFMISGALMVLVLLISLLNISPFAPLRDGLRQILAGAATVEEFTQEMRHFGYEWLNIGAELPAETLDLPVFESPQTFETYEIPKPTAYDEHLNPQIPGPLRSPGLWD